MNEPEKLPELTVRLPPPRVMLPEPVSAPVVRVPPPRVTMPVAARELIESEKLFRLRVAPLATVTAVLLESALAMPMVNVPWLMLVAPV